MRRLAVLASLLATSALADPVALVIGNADYERLPDVAGAAGARGVIEDYRAAGFTVISARDANGQGMIAAAADFVEALEEVGEGDPVAVILAGHFVHAGESSVLVGTNASGTDPSALFWGLSPDMLASAMLAAEGDGPRLLVLAASSGLPADGLVEPGTAETAIDGVTVLRGEAEAALRAARGLTYPGVRLTGRAARRAGLTMTGDDRFALLPSTVLPPPVVERPARPSGGSVISPPSGSAGGQAEREYWATVERFDTRTGYEAYLNRYPNGAYAATARARLSSITDDPLRIPREAETALNLSREQRRGIQADLVTLGFDTRGVDGIFGNGTRAAVRSWQSREGVRETGYLDAGQIATLDRQAARRQAELDIEAERRRAQIEAEDRAFWEASGRGRDEAGLRRYLERYPDGLYAEQAEANLAAIAEENRAASAAEDQAAWERARRVNSSQAYRRYLAAFPQGAHVREAQQWLEQGGVDQAAVAAENALGLDAIGRRLVETGLRQAGYDAGSIDGTFDEATRRAIRRYQRDRGLPVTGYMNQAIVVRMVAESFLQ